MSKIQAPENCPSCDSVLEWSNHLLYCRNPQCGNKAKKQIEHFAKTLKIKGLGPVSVSKLDLNSINDIYILTEDDIAELLSSDRLAEKLFSEIENSKNATLNRLLPAFSIPLIGKTAAEKLSITCKTIDDITDETCRQAGLGPKATNNLLDWLESEFPLYEHLPFSFEFKTLKTSEIKAVVCITGKLKSYKTKAEASKALKERGYLVKPNLTKDVTILVNESGIESAKTKTARDSGIQIVTNLSNFILEDYIGE